MGATFILFWILSTLAFAAAMGILVSKKELYSVLRFIVLVFAISGHFILMNAQFLAIVNILVVAGALGVMFLYGLILVRSHRDSEQVKILYMRIAGVIASLLLLIVLTAAVSKASQNEVVLRPGTWIGHVDKIGEELFSRFFVPFVISGLLLLSVLVGTVVIIINREPAPDPKSVTL